MLASDLKKNSNPHSHTHTHWSLPKTRLRNEPSQGKKKSASRITQLPKEKGGFFGVANCLRPKKAGASKKGFEEEEEDKRSIERLKCTCRGGNRASTASLPESVVLQPVDYWPREEVFRTASVPATLYCAALNGIDCVRLYRLIASLAGKTALWYPSPPPPVPPCKLVFVRRRMLQMALNIYYHSSFPNLSSFETVTRFYPPSAPSIL